MKKLLIAITAALGVASAAVPASAGSSFGVSVGYYSAPTAYSYSYYTPSYTYTPPVYSYVAPTYYAPAPVVTYSFGTYGGYGNSYYKPHRKYRGRGHHRNRHHYRSHRTHW